MNQTLEEAALQSDIRTLIEGAENDAGVSWHPLGTVAILFIAYEFAQDRRRPAEQTKGDDDRHPSYEIEKWLLERDLSAIRAEKRNAMLSYLPDPEWRKEQGSFGRYADSMSPAKAKEKGDDIDKKIGAFIAHTIRAGNHQDLFLLFRAMGMELSAWSSVTSSENRIYLRIVDWLSSRNLKTPEGRRRAASVFEDEVRFVVERNGKRLGQFVTPEPVAKLMLELAEIAPGQRIYDPCCGLGEILVGATHRLSGTASSSCLSVPLGAVSGVETDALAHCITLCRLLLTGFESVSLELDDALKKPLPGAGTETGFDRVLAAPPWGRGSIESPYEQFPFPTAHAEELFLQHVMAHLRPGGRAVVALPERMLVHTESSDLRKELLSQYRVEGVVALPPGAFEPCTSIATSLVVFSRAQPGETVPFVTVSPVAWEASSAATSDRDDGAIENERTSARFARGEWLPDISISGMIGDHGEFPAGPLAPHVQSWAVPVRDLMLRDYELIAKKPDSEMLDVELSRLVETNSSLPAKRLDEVAEVRMSQYREAPRGGVYARLLPADVTDVGLRRPSGTIHVGEMLHIPEPDFLRDGDLIVSIRETIGNIGLVEDIYLRYGGVVADQGIAVVRPHRGINPQFLAALLRSPAYWFWLSGHATGSPILLSTAVLSSLKVPVPPLPVQDALLEELSEPRADALAVLYRLLSGTARHPVALWLERPLAASLAAGGPSSDPRGMDALTKLAAEIRSLATSPAAPMAGDRSIGRWLEAARRAADVLDDLGSVPSGSGRLVILEFAAARFREALGVVDRADQPIGKRLRSVTRAMVEFVEEEVHAMQRRGTLDIAAEPAEVLAGATDEVRLRVTNSSPVPLRKVRVTARQADRTVGEDEVSYLAEDQQHEIPLVVRTQEDTQSLQVAVAWRARRLDATAVQGQTKVSVLVRSSKEAAATGDLGASPYIVGNPVDRDEMFFGRDGIMDRIRRHLGGDHANVILLEGNRRTGKTSILQQLEKEDALPGWIPVYCSFQDTDSIATPDVFRLLAKQTGWTLADAGIETWIPELPAPASGRPFKVAFLSALRGAFAGSHPYERLRLYLSTALEAAKPRRVLLMLDEFDKVQEGIDGGITSPQVPENLRHLLQHQPGLGAIITGSRRLKRLREEYWSALFGFGYRIGVSALPKEEARRLVTEPVAPRIRYLPQARDRLVELCACHPFLIQSLCSRVFDQAAAGSERTITRDIVERAATEMVRDNEHFQTLWGYAGSERRRLILALSDRMADSPDAVNLDLIGMKFEEYGVWHHDDLADDITELRELELLEIDDSYRGGTYRLSIPLMAKWLLTNVTFDDLVVRARQEADAR